MGAKSMHYTSKLCLEVFFEIFKRVSRKIFLLYTGRLARAAPGLVGDQVQACLMDLTCIFSSVFKALFSHPPPGLVLGFVFEKLDLTWHVLQVRRKEKAPGFRSNWTKHWNGRSYLLSCEVISMWSQMANVPQLQPNSAKWLISCCGGPITPNPTQNRCGWCFLLMGNIN